eukprot:scaffold90451_cov13-Tisochrysis_lutea.AAC.1
MILDQKPAHLSTDITLPQDVRPTRLGHDALRKLLVRTEQQQALQLFFTGLHGTLEKELMPSGRL